MGTFWQRLLRGSWQVAAQPDWADFAGPAWTERIMSIQLSDQFHAKQGRSTGRWVMHRQGSGVSSRLSAAGDRLSAESRQPIAESREQLVVFLKRHYGLSRWRGLLATLFPSAGWSPAMQESRHLDHAAALGLPVPRAVAAGERIGPWGRLQSFLAVQELTDMLPLHEAIPLAAQRLGGAEFAHWKRTLAVELARLARALHQHRLFHKDFYLCHFFIHQDDTRTLPNWQGRVQLIDLHRLARHPWTWRIWQAKDLGQLIFSSDIEEINARDRLRFWFAYAGRARHSVMARLVRRFVLLKWRMYRRHNLKHHRSKAGKVLGN
jgi:heptose I phosphotransferase